MTVTNGRSQKRAGCFFHKSAAHDASQFVLLLNARVALPSALPSAEFFVGLQIIVICDVLVKF